MTKGTLSDENFGWANNMTSNNRSSRRMTMRSFTDLPPREIDPLGR
jgi:hypothetical protein